MLRITPLWVKLQGLLVHFWSKVNLSRIASIIGKPICVDRLIAEAEHISFSRLLIKTNVTQVLPIELYIEEEGSILTQAVVYNWQPGLSLIVRDWIMHRENINRGGKSQGKRKNYNGMLLKEEDLSLLGVLETFK
ncbi:hypothetical protein BC332_15497 [Capsicum chinense]|nr:hypothetical protein BC332_15497 [Capsicum chinense]